MQANGPATGQRFTSGGFERCDGLLPAHRREIVEKFFEAVTGGQVVDQILEGDAGSNEHRGAAQNLRVAMNYGIVVRHGVLSTHKNMVHPEPTGGVNACARPSPSPRAHPYTCISGCRGIGCP
jgi:hypothetical protein